MCGRCNGPPWPDLRGDCREFIEHPQAYDRGVESPCARRANRRFCVKGVCIPCCNKRHDVCLQHARAANGKWVDPMAHAPIRMRGTGGETRSRSHCRICRRREVARRRSARARHGGTSTVTRDGCTDDGDACGRLRARLRRRSNVTAMHGAKARGGDALRPVAASTRMRSLGCRTRRPDRLDTTPAAPGPPAFDRASGAHCAARPMTQPRAAQNSCQSLSTAIAAAGCAARRAGKAFTTAGPTLRLPAGAGAAC